MKKFIVVFEELVADEFPIWAKNKEEAFAIAEERYHKGKIVLEPGEVHHRRMGIQKDDGSEEYDWLEF